MSRRRARRPEGWPGRADPDFVYRCIMQEAWVLKRRLPWYDRSNDRLEDLVQEGFVVASKLKRRYRARRGKFTTLLVPAVRNHFADLLEAVWRHKRQLPAHSPSLERRRWRKMATARPSEDLSSGMEDRQWSDLEVLLGIPQADEETKQEFDRIKFGYRVGPVPETPGFQRLRWRVYHRLLLGVKEPELEREVR